MFSIKLIIMKSLYKFQIHHYLHNNYTGKISTTHYQ